MRAVLDFFLHIDQHIGNIIQAYGVWTYAIMFAVIFCETGLVVLPLLPGDSLLFALGAFTAQGVLHFGWLVLILFLATLLGDNVNYWIGHHMGAKIFSGQKIRWLNRNHLIETERFYERHGGVTIILARFIPIIRTFAPFVAGIGHMSYYRFLGFSFVGAMSWIVGGVGAGYVFGNIPVVKDNFTLVILVIIFISLLPAIIKFLHHKWSVRQSSIDPPTVS